MEILLRNSGSKNIYDSWGHKKTAVPIFHLIRSFNVKKFVEIGVESGKLSLLIFNEFNDIYTYLVDISFQGCDLNSFRKYTQRFSVFNMKSTEASTYFQDGSLDMIYIDASHLYEDIIEDLKIWSPKV